MQGKEVMFGSKVNTLGKDAGEFLVGTGGVWGTRGKLVEVPNDLHVRSII